MCKCSLSVKLQSCTIPLNLFQFSQLTRLTRTDHTCRQTNRQVVSHSAVRLYDNAVCLSHEVEHHLESTVIIKGLTCRPAPLWLTSFSQMNSWSTLRTTNRFFQISLKIPLPQNFRIQPTFSVWRCCCAESCGPWTGNRNQVKTAPLLYRAVVSACDWTVELLLLSLQFINQIIFYIYIYNIKFKQIKY